MRDSVAEVQTISSATSDLHTAIQIGHSTRVFLDFLARVRLFGEFRFYYRIRLAATGIFITHPKFNNRRIFRIFVGDKGRTRTGIAICLLPVRATRYAVLLEGFKNLWLC